MNTPVRIDKHFSGAELKLAEAAARGDAAEVTRLIRDDHANPNAISAEGMPLLLWPVQAGNIAGTRALLDNGADPNRPIPRFGAPIFLTAQLKDPGFLRLFLKHGGDANLRNADGEALTRIAMLHNNWDSVKLLIERGAQIDAGAHDDSDQRTLLGFYSGTGQFDKVHWLLEKGADATARQQQAAVPARIGAPYIIEKIYWYPIDAGKFPDGAAWQKKCQQWLRTHGIDEIPPEPKNMSRMREDMGLPKPVYGETAHDLRSRR
jgi:ankyrin repeat protein